MSFKYRDHRQTAVLQNCPLADSVMAFDVKPPVPSTGALLRA
jgi:hypothetical protein